MSNLFSSRSMDVVALQNGRFGIQIIGTHALSRTVGNFESRDEADAWILRQTLIEEQAEVDPAILKPGPTSPDGA